ncbi:MAG: YcbK family protein, partial [Gaiellaceae bacterium]
EGTRDRGGQPSATQGEQPPLPSPVSISANGGGLGRGPVAAADTRPRFFFAGNCRLRLSHAHFGTTLDVRYRRPDGIYDPEALKEIRHFFRSREDGREGAVSLRLIELLGYVEDHFHPKQVTLLSGYRSPEFNEDLRAAGGQAAQTSLHTQGLAADVTMTGVNLRQVWLQLRELRTGGAGYYRKGNFLHLDTGPPRFWEEGTSRVSENLSAGNARIFVRTDFDRYVGIDGAVCSVYSVTAFPLLISARADVVSPLGGSSVMLEPLGTGIERRGDCLAITAPADAYQFRVVAAAPEAELKSHERPHLLLKTCEPRIERTPLEVESNPIEVRYRRPAPDH